MFDLVLVDMYIVKHPAVMPGANITPSQNYDDPGDGVVMGIVAWLSGLSMLLERPPFFSP